MLEPSRYRKFPSIRRGRSLASGAHCGYHIAMEPKPIKYPLGTLSRVEAKSVGEPGHRTFNLVLESAGPSCSVWLEKEQLFQLGVYLQEVIQSLSAEERERQGEPVESQWPGEGAPIEFKAGEVMMSHDPAGHAFYLLAYEREDAEREDADSEEELASVSFWISVAQAEVLAQEALRICAAGRPRCFLCGLPINPEGHVCPRSNGHTVLETG